ncbi:MAG: PQQ-like beta-propeller repeat protein [Elusimicrobia bacterium]|nr:PQQ-like beta-propeller repeat protein [Elusimicrobiota bacterium]
MSVLTAIMLQPPLQAENHYSKPHRNCRILGAVTLPMRQARKRDAMPARAGWHLQNGADLVFVNGSTVTALNPETGAQAVLAEGVPLEHQVQAGAGPSGIYSVTAPRIARGSTDTIVARGYAPGTYELLWTQRPFSKGTLPLIAMPLADDTGVFLGAGNQVTLRRASDGSEIWRRALDSLAGSYPALSSQTIVLHTTNGMEALSLSNGRTLWQHPIDAAAFNPSRAVVIEGSRVYFPMGERTVAALDLETGTLLWESAALPSLIDYRHPVIAGADGIYVPLYGGLARLSLEGTLAWSRRYAFMNMRQMGPSMVLAANAVFIGGADGIYALSPDAGDVLWSEEGLGQIVSIEYMAPRVVAVNSQGAMYVFEP